MPNPNGAFTIDGTARKWRGITQGAELFASLIADGNIPHVRDSAGVLTVIPEFTPTARIVFVPVKAIVFNPRRRRQRFKCAH